KGHSWESYQGSLSSNMRYNLRRRAKQIFDQLHGEVIGCQQAESVAKQLDQIFDLHWKRWKLRGGSDGFAGPEIRAFHHTAATRLFEKGWLKLYLLEVDHKPVAGIYGIV